MLMATDFVVCDKDFTIELVACDRKISTLLKRPQHDAHTLFILCWDLRHTLRGHRQGPFVE
jgi:hypothetical protein